MSVKQTGVVDVAVADGSPLVLTALSEFFDRNREFSLIATTATAEAFLDTVQRVPVDVAVIDWQLPRLGGEQVIRTLKSLGSVVKVVVYGALDPPDVVRRAMAAGAAGFCPRSNSPEELLEVVRGVARGQMLFPYFDIRDLHRDPVNELTDRERALLVALSRGLSNKALGAEFGISVNTVKFHLKNLFEKLSIANRAEAIAFYYSSGLAERLGKGQ
ncbi:MAG TPA: response regulator transcription factor [Aestuariivirgaceae bacterium]|jgi:DNA-binding NarL/FixJ family response regulator|nr:response regulator transcription factor [Aestuariivirgaceae bacterium]